MSKYIRNGLYLALGFSLILPGITMFKAASDASNPEMNVTLMESLVSSIPYMIVIMVGIIFVLIGGSVIIKIINEE